MGQEMFKLPPLPAIPKVIGHVLETEYMEEDNPGDIIFDEEVDEVVGKGSLNLFPDLESQ